MSVETALGGMRPAIDHELRRYDVPLLADVALQDQVRRDGFAVLDPVLDRGSIRDLLDLAGDFLRRLGGPVGDQFLTVGRIEDVVLRAETIAQAGAIVRPLLEPIYVAGTQFLCSAFQIKPPSPGSALNPHQDSSLVDERRWPGIYAWIPLVDTDERNGGLYVVPGSHRFGNLQRTLNVPWQFAGLEDVFRPWCVPLTVPAGGVVLFDSATVHGSPPNHGDQIRIALNNFGRPAGAALMHYYQDDQTAPGMVESFEIEPSFLFSDDIMVRPGPQHRRLGEEPHHRFACDAATLDELCRLGGALTGSARNAS
jgi:hypothetical protein